MARSDSPPRIAKEFGKRVRNLRKSLEMTQLALAQATDMDLSFVSDVERGRRNVTLLTIARLAEALEVDPSELVRGLRP